MLNTLNNVWQYIYISLPPESLSEKLVRNSSKAHLVTRLKFLAILTPSLIDIQTGFAGVNLKRKYKSLLCGNTQKLFRSGMALP